jgi:outer membrane protein OmpA-like peptidoglycan-associated protein
MSARSWCAALLLLGAADVAAINLAVGPRLVPEIPLLAAVEEVAARRPLAIAAAPTPAAEPAPAAPERTPAPAAAPVLTPPAAEPAPEPQPAEVVAAEPAPAEVAAAEPAPEPAPTPAPEPTPAPSVQARTAPPVDSGGALPTEPTIIYFATDRATLWPAAQARLDEIAAALSANPEWGLMVAGHTDARGTDDHNEHLSERRVRRVREYLASRGIAEDRVRGRAFGERQPVADDEADSTALHRNRRVEITYTRRDP